MRTEGALTASEQSICNLVVMGNNNKEIARRLNLSLRTVESHRYRVYKKMGVSNVFQLVRKFFES